MGRRLFLIRRLAPLLLGLTVLTGCLHPAPPPGWQAPIGDVIARHNVARAQHGLSAFGVDPGMNANAQFHANRLLAASGGTCNNLFHSGELGSWYGGFAAAENVLCGNGGCPGDGAGIVNAWMNSPEHAGNILNPAYAWIGVGISCNGALFFAVAHYRSP